MTFFRYGFGSSNSELWISADNSPNEKDRFSLFFICLINHLYKSKFTKFDFNSAKDELVVFSEIFYEGGWQAYIDDNPVDHFRSNYLLRGLKVPAGNHKIRFEFSRSSYSLGSVISLISSLLIIGLVVYLIYLSFFSKSIQVQDLEEEVLEL